MGMIIKLAIPVLVILYICMGAMFATIWREHWKKYLAITCFVLSAASIFALVKMAEDNKSVSVDTIDEISNHFFDGYYVFVILFAIFFVMGCILFLKKVQNHTSSYQGQSYFPQKYPSASQYTDDAASSPVEQDVVTELSNWKTLLDRGVVTQEEFDQKKRQLLGLPATYSAPVTAQNIGRCVVCGCENVPVECVEVLVAGMTRKRMMCRECGAKYQQPALDVLPQQSACVKSAVEYFSPDIQQPVKTEMSTAAPGVPDQNSGQDMRLRKRVLTKFGVAAVLFGIVCITMFALISNTGTTDKSFDNAQGTADPVARAALEQLVEMVKANNNTDAYQNVNGKARTYFMRPLYVSAYSTSELGFRYEDYLEDDIALREYGRDFPTLHLYTDITFDEEGIMKVYYSFYVKYLKTTIYEKDEIINGTVNIPVKDFSPTVDFNLSSPNIDLQAKWLDTDMNVSELGAFVKDKIRGHVFMMLDYILYVSDVSLEDLGFAEGIEAVVPEIYPRENNTATQETPTTQSSNAETSNEEVIELLHELVPINNKISELHMTITFGVTMNGIVNYDQLTDLISEYAAVTDVVCDFASGTLSDAKIEIFQHYQKLINRLDQFGAEYDSTYSESTRAIYWKQFHNYYLDWQMEWFALSDKYWSNAN